jgi:hypothetical protein
VDVTLACLVGLKASGLTWSASGSRALTTLVVSFGCRGARSFRVAVFASVRHDIETRSGRQMVKSLSLFLFLSPVMDAYSGPQELNGPELVSMDRAWLCGSQWTA